MAVITVLKMGDPRLLLQAEKVKDFGSDALKADIADMVDTMRHFIGVGLAAPQIGISKQIIILEAADNPRYPDAGVIELDILFNPKIIHFSQQKDFAWEGCLSLPGMRGKVERARTITYQAVNQQGQPYTATVQGFHARVIQHEIDHLNGILYPQRLESFNDFGFEDSLPDFQQTLI